MQKRTLLTLLICVLIVVGCVQDDAVPTEVVRVVETATPTPTQTPIPSTATPQPTGMETAVSHYTTLIQQAPDSPWSWLAWARLAPVENN